MKSSLAFSLSKFSSDIFKLPKYSVFLLDHVHADRYVYLQNKRFDLFVLILLYQMQTNLIWPSMFEVDGCMCQFWTMNSIC